MDYVSPLTPLQRVIPPLWADVQATEEDEPVCKRRCRDIVKRAMLAPHKNMAALSEAVISRVLLKRPDLRARISDFLNYYSEHIERIKKHGWIELTSQLGDEMMDVRGVTKCSLEQFRLIANTFIDGISIELGKEIGLPDALWTSCGTIGYKSDVDITLKIKFNSRIIENAVLYKTFRDCLHTFAFGGSSSFQLHTESLMPHPAEFNLSHFLHSQKAHFYFQTGEKASVVLQHYLSLCKNPSDYTKSKKMELESITDAEERKAMALLYDQVEELMKLLDGRIGEKPRELAYVPIRIRLAERCTEVLQEIEQESKKSMVITKMGFDDEIQETISLQKELDSLHLEFQCILMIVAALQCEGTLSVAEGKATLLEEGGQIHARIVRKQSHSKEEFFSQGSDEVLDGLLVHPVFRREASSPLLGTLKSSSHNISNKFAKHVLGGIVEEALKPSFQRPTGLTFLIAAYEEAMQLQHVILEGLNGINEPGRVAINGGKYFLRVTRNICQAVMKFKKERGPRGWIGLLDKANKLEKISESLEKCKRGVSISSDAAAILLTEAIIDGLTPRGRADAGEIKPKVEKILRKFDFRGKYFERLLPKEEHLRKLRKKLTHLKGLFIDVDNHRILGILQAHAGFDRFSTEKPDLKLNDIHKEAVPLTLQCVKLTDDAQVRQFLSDVLEAGVMVRNKAREKEFLAKSKISMARFYNFPEIIRKCL